MTDGANILSIEAGAKLKALRLELKEWRLRNDRAYQFDWDWRAREIIANEIKRIRVEIHEFTGLWV